MASALPQHSKPMLMTTVVYKSNINLLHWKVTIKETNEIPGLFCYFLGVLRLSQNYFFYASVTRFMWRRNQAEPVGKGLARKPCHREPNTRRGQTHDHPDWPESLVTENNFTLCSEQTIWHNLLRDLLNK